MRIKVTPGNARLGATIIVIIVIGLYEEAIETPYSLPQEHRTEEATRSSGSTIESKCRSDRQTGK